MKLQGISKEGLKRIAKKVKGQGIDLMSELESLGVPIENHESDVYVPVTPETTALIDQYEFKSNVTEFISEIDGERWYDIPFLGLNTYNPGTGKISSRKRAEEDTGQDYLKTVKSVAQGIKEEYENYGDTDIEQMIHEQVDGNHYIIYYHANLIVLQNSDNADAIDDVGMEIDTSQGWQNILTQVAYFAMEQDVRDALEELGYDGEGFGDEEIEEEF